jgi:hypothetical protein
MFIEITVNSYKNLYKLFLQITLNVFRYGSAAGWLRTTIVVWRGSGPEAQLVPINRFRRDALHATLQDFPVPDTHTSDLDP